MSTSINNGARSMLKAGVLVGPLFVGLSLVLALASQGFDLTKHEVSLLLNGDLGWIQMINFIAIGLLSIVCAVGLKRTLKSGRASKWGPILLTVFGVLFIIAAIFHPDGHHSFPLGASEGMLSPATAHAGVHGMAFSLLAVVTVINGFVFARRWFAERRGRAIYSIVNSVAILVFVGAGSGMVASGNGGLALLGAAIAITFWVTAVAAFTLSDISKTK